jgi:hypothetical protein
LFHAYGGWTDITKLIIAFQNFKNSLQKALKAQVKVEAREIFKTAVSVITHCGFC